MVPWTPGRNNTGGSVREDGAVNNGETRFLSPAVCFVFVFLLPGRAPYRLVVMAIGGGRPWLDRLGGTPPPGSFFVCFSLFILLCRFLLLGSKHKLFGGLSPGDLIRLPDLNRRGDTGRGNKSLEEEATSTVDETGSSVYGEISLDGS